MDDMMGTYTTCCDEWVEEWMEVNLKDKLTWREKWARQNIGEENKTPGTLMLFLLTETAASKGFTAA